jgi:hypothetical protein
VSENLDQTIRAGASNEGGFFRRIAAEISVMIRPMGKGSMNVIATLKKGFL